MICSSLLLICLLVIMCGIAAPGTPITLRVFPLLLVSVAED
jgi:hypothetical protein